MMVRLFEDPLYSMDSVRFENWWISVGKTKIACAEAPEESSMKGGVHFEGTRRKQVEQDLKQVG